MDIFWEPFIEPILRQIKPESIVEIGASEGANTIKIVKYCKETGTRCVIVDPLEIGNIELIREDLKAAGTHLRDLSLKVIPALTEGDVFLLDGDHNWYTVYHELKAIFDRKDAGALKRPPVVFFHDVFWPYARRDLYYDPTNIPKAYQQPIGHDGLVPGQEIQDPDRGMNFGLAQAIRDGGERNGVLTGIEDFIRDRHLADQYHFMKIPGFHGLGCLFPKGFYEKSVEEFVSTQFHPPAPLLTYIQALETRRLNEIMAQSGLKKEIQRLCDLLRDNGIENSRSFTILNRMIEELKNQIDFERSQFEAELKPKAYLRRVFKQARSSVTGAPKP